MASADFSAPVPAHRCAGSRDRPGRCGDLPG